MRNKNRIENMERSECISLFFFFPQYVFLKHHPDWAGETKDLQKSTDQFFKTKLNGNLIYLCDSET